jgi:hypothetical protein
MSDLSAKSSKDVIAALIESGADVATFPQTCELNRYELGSLKRTAIVKQHVEAFKWLHERGGDCTKETLYLASMHGSMPLVRFMCECATHAPRVEADYHLHIAVVRGYGQIARYLSAFVSDKELAVHREKSWLFNVAWDDLIRPKPWWSKIGDAFWSAVEWLAKTFHNVAAIFRPGA